jgi:uroporphyrinogen decarboxylase
VRRSETTELVVEISLQPWRAFRPDGVILFSDILTPLPGVGVPFDIDETKGPVVASPIRSLEAVRAMHPLDVSGLGFVGDSLRLLRAEVGAGAAVLGFVGSPWTLATYLVEGKSTSTYTVIKTMAFQAPAVLTALLDTLADAIGDYIAYQIAHGAQAIMLFDSWGGQLPPAQWDAISRPAIERVVRRVRADPRNAGVPIVLYANGSGGLLERMAQTGVDAVGLDWTVDMADARRRLGAHVPVQGNVDPAVLFAPPEAVVAAVNACCAKAGAKGHILNLGHGVLVGTPEESVAAFFDAARAVRFT